jgi:hypothetical protein
VVKSDLRCVEEKPSEAVFFLVEIVGFSVAVDGVTYDGVVNRTEVNPDLVGTTG